jgi:hypothetical protein
MSGRLSGRSIFLSASVPRPGWAAAWRPDSKDCGEADDRRVPDAQFEIEQAVVSLARAVFAAGGQLVFGGHPTISPLVATVAGEYRTFPRGEAGEEAARPPVLIYQSEAFREYAPEATLLMFRTGVANVRWTPAENGEEFKPGMPGPLCPLSLEAMRDRMIAESRPDAMVCIGGMAGIFDEVSLFTEQRRGRPVYALRATGGASAILAEQSAPGLRVIDDEVMARVAERRRGLAGGVPDGEGRAGRPVVPYPLIMQTLVEEIAGGERWTSA